METLPEEILIEILDCLEVEDLISAQQTCKALSKSARANTLWRYKCFEKSPSATMRRENDILKSLTGALMSLSLSDEPASHPTRDNGDNRRPEPQTHASRRAQATNKWDLSADGERVDWYSEYRGRNAPLSTQWLTVKQHSSQQEVRGVSTLDGSTKLVGFLEDHSIALWDLKEASNGKRNFHELGRSKPGLLSQCDDITGSFVVDGLSSFSTQQKSFVAVGNVLSEIDLNTLEVISRSKYAWPITALSQTGNGELPLTVGTQWSLHILDPRVPVKPLSKSSHDRVEEVPAMAGTSTALLPNLSEDSKLLPSQFGISSPFAANPGPSIWAPGSPSWKPSHRLQNPHWMAYARVEPGPLSILHHADNEILIGGRFPSILSYDRRYFPRLQYVIHSSASLSSLASIPYPPSGSSSSLSSTSTLIACGEYRGRGSLELYSLPHVKASSTSTDSEDLYSYKNRQDAAKSKLLSVASQGTKIVYSDSEGGLKWVERDGRSLVRRWNINDYNFPNPFSNLAWVSNDQVARKIIPLATPDSEYGQRGDGDLLIWTGERVGVVTTKTQYADHEEMVREVENGEALGEEQKLKEREEEYSKTMRQALERQADERRWMSRFRFKTGRW